MAHLYRCDRNVLGAPNLLSQNLHIVKPSNLTNPGRLYPQTSNLSTLKTYTKWQKMSNKLMKRFDNI